MEYTMNLPYSESTNEKLLEAFGTLLSFDGISPEDIIGVVEYFKKHPKKMEVISQLATGKIGLMVAAAKLV